MKAYLLLYKCHNCLHVMLFADGATHKANMQCPICKTYFNSHELVVESLRINMEITPHKTIRFD